ncbi:MAG: nucleoside triphosphate pyrophosphohydrolase, partial [Chloroflexi bacterium]|nr:nucleoside triphosphate pyrophosphohydrolase [Chloroflexota bacterium]
MLHVVGLGPGSYDLVTLRAARLIESADRLFLRTAVHPAVAELPAGLAWSSFDNLYEQASDFGEVYETIVSQLLEAARGEASVVYAVPGDPAFGEETVRLLAERASGAGVTPRLVPAVSFLSPVLAAIVGSASGHLQILDATALAEPDPLLPTLVYQVYSALIAS